MVDKRYATVTTLNYGVISLRSQGYEITGIPIDTIDLSDPEEYAIIYRDNRTNQPFAIVYKE